MYMS